MSQTDFVVSEIQAGIEAMLSDCKPHKADALKPVSTQEKFDHASRSRRYHLLLTAGVPQTDAWLKAAGLFIRLTPIIQQRLVRAHKNSKVWS